MTTTDGQNRDVYRTEGLQEVNLFAKLLYLFSLVTRGVESGMEDLHSIGFDEVAHALA